MFMTVLQTLTMKGYCVVGLRSLGNLMLKTLQRNRVLRQMVDHEKFDFWFCIRHRSRKSTTNDKTIINVQYT
jgi:hypothetical protein